MPRQRHRRALLPPLALVRVVLLLAVDDGAQAPVFLRGPELGRGRVEGRRPLVLVARASKT